jgi:hypothetical protein
VPALDVVGEDFQSRRRVDQRFPREEQILVRLDRVRLLRVRTDHDRSVEDAARAAVQNSLVHLAARRVRGRVVDRRVRIEVLRAGAREEPVELALRSLSFEPDGEVRAREGGPEREIARREARGARLAHGHRVHVARRRALLLQLVVVEDGAVRERDLGHRAPEVRPMAREALDDRGLAPFAREDETARVGHDRILGARSVVQDLDWGGQGGARLDEQNDDALGEGLVESPEGVRLRAGDVAEARGEKLRRLLERLREPKHADTFRLPFDPDRRTGSSPVEPPRRIHDRPDARVSPRLLLRRRETELLESLAGRPAARGEPLRLAQAGRVDLVQVRGEALLFGDGFHGLYTRRAAAGAGSFSSQL